MDPLTHALAGATLAWAAAGRQLGRRALVIGAAAALLPDVDVLIRSAADPLLAIEHHRGFTHSLLFVPAGGAIAALPFAARLDRPRRGRALAAGMVAYLSHGLLDAATTYGTQLWWPFSRTRVGLDIISIIDPLFTLILLAAVVAAFRARRRAVTVALTIAAAWLALGFVQRERATAAQTSLATARGHRVTRAAVFPTIGNNIVWRSLYESAGTLHIDRIRVPWLGRATFAGVTSVPLAAPDAVAHDARMLRDYQRFAWFSDRWLARAPADPSIVGDARYSLHSDRYEPVWGIRFHPQADQPTEWVNRSRERRVSTTQLWRELRGRDDAFRPLP